MVKPARVKLGALKRAKKDTRVSGSKTGPSSQKSESDEALTFCAHAENAFARYKQTFGGRLNAKRNDSQENETLIACGILNKMLALGSPDSYPIT